jgi:hypothetical protein
MLVGHPPEQQRIGREQTLLGDRFSALVEELELPAAALELAGVTRRLHDAIEREERRHRELVHLRPPFAGRTWLTVGIAPVADVRR